VECEAQYLLLSPLTTASAEAWEELEKKLTTNVLDVMRANGLVEKSAPDASRFDEETR